MKTVYYIGGVMCDPNYLEHHGIKGQRWGVRRFQNADGTLTAAGKQRYGNQNDENDAANKIQKMDKIVLSEEKIQKAVQEKDQGIIQRAKKVADIGLKALIKMGRPTSIEDENNITGNDRWWFLFEDQTIGLPQIADLMANQKWSGQKMKQYIRDIRSLYYDKKINQTSYSSPAVFYFLECGDMKTIDNYIDCCEDIIKNSK